MMSLTFGLFTQVSGSGPLGPLVYINKTKFKLKLQNRKEKGDDQELIQSYPTSLKSERGRNTLINKQKPSQRHAQKIILVKILQELTKPEPTERTALSETGPKSSIYTDVLDIQCKVSESNVFALEWTLIWVTRV